MTLKIAKKKKKKPSIRNTSQQYTRRNCCASNVSDPSHYDSALKATQWYFQEQHNGESLHPLTLVLENLKGGLQKKDSKYRIT